MGKQFPHYQIERLRHIEAMVAMQASELEATRKALGAAEAENNRLREALRELVEKGSAVCEPDRPDGGAFDRFEDALAKAKDAVDNG